VAGGPALTPSSRIGSDDAEEPEVAVAGFQTCADADADAVRAGWAEPWSQDVWLGPPWSVHNSFGKCKKVNCLDTPNGLVRAGWGLARALRIPGGLSRSHLANMWLPLRFPRPAHCYLYPPDGGGRGGGCLLQTLDTVSRRGPG
jgi:hypothetical protein